MFMRLTELWGEGRGAARAGEEGGRNEQAIVYARTGRHPEPREVLRGKQATHGC